MAIPWRSLNRTLFDVLGVLRGATTRAETIADRLEAAGILERALSALGNPCPWPSSAVAAGAAKLMPGATGDSLPPLADAIHLALRSIGRLHERHLHLPGPGRFLWNTRRDLQRLSETAPRYSDIDINYVGAESHDAICSHIQPTLRGIRRAIRELGLAEWHYKCLLYVLAEGGALDEAEKRARQAHDCLEDALIYISTIDAMMRDDSFKVWSFYSMGMPGAYRF